jgi:hypothetical protein
LKRIIQIIRRRRFFITRLKVINALPKTPPERRYCCRSGCVIALMELLTPMEKKKNYE